jgi:hypothetical protein
MRRAENEERKLIGRGAEEGEEKKGWELVEIS